MQGEAGLFGPQVMTTHHAQYSLYAFLLPSRCVYNVHLANRDSFHISLISRHYVGIHLANRYKSAPNLVFDKSYFSVCVCRVNGDPLAHQADMGLREGRELLDTWERLGRRETLGPVVPLDKLDLLDFLVDQDRGYIIIILTHTLRLFTK